LNFDPVLMILAWILFPNAGQRQWAAAMSAIGPCSAVCCAAERGWMGGGVRYIQCIFDPQYFQLTQWGHNLIVGWGPSVF
jgi:hypothetical protein